ncbi:CRISPR-associated helicase Cas3' [Nocardia vaccinii]|uniref:CRISPR-associated helicase Cas3' n=1 Tax=Nocardia vaccinii TaxID=1822 RepID=UPI001FE20B50|nr:CRISPR-associated helicase Cas3' [Nocardia vaccinii]
MAARSVWAKSPNSDGAWLPLWQHMDDSADVAGLLFDHWLAPAVADRLADEFGGQRESARAAVRFLAGMHDLGKATPAFAVQHDLLAQRMRACGLGMPVTRRELVDRVKTPHAVAGHHLLIGWLRGRGWSKRRAAAWAVVLGGHHGVPPDSVVVQDSSPLGYPQLYGEGCWESVRAELADRVAARTGAVDYLDQWCDLAPSAGFQIIVTGLVIMADWIASNEEVMPFLTGELPEVEDATDRAARAFGRLALPSAWRAQAAGLSVSDLFAARFRLPAGAEPRPVQIAACEVARGMTAPGLLIIEAAMGEGKTEAALAAAEIMAERWGAGGVHVALPTQATTNAMFDRVVAWLDAMGADGQQVGAITLSHGKARLNRLFGGMVRQGWRRSLEIGCDEDSSGHERGRGRPGHSVVAHAWLSGRKKSQLANFVVGTVDQLLFAGLKARHLMLRHLALAGKVVVLDEVHAYDAYMNSYLTKVVMWLGAYRVPVIALSATLPNDRRTELLHAYQQGFLGSAADLPAMTDSIEVAGYPALTWTEGSDVRVRGVEPSSRSTRIQVEALGGGADDDLDELVAVLKDLLRDGGCALVVRNTVRRVLSTAERLETEFPGEVCVAHARFLAADRARKDTELLDEFGSPDRAVRRPDRKIVVASQVVEQSLDIDFDVLITDLAPIDLILQRMGRLHRHERGKDQCQRPSRLRTARTYIAGADFSSAPPALETAAARYVYREYPLLRAAAVLQPRFGGTIALPNDIAPLVQLAYGPDVIGPSTWQEAIVRARADWEQNVTRRAEKATHHQIAAPGPAGRPIIGWLSANIGEADDESHGQGQVRDGAPSLEVVVIEQSESGAWFTPHWLPEGEARRPVPRGDVPDEDTAAVIASCALRLPLTFSNAAAEEALWAATPEAWESSPVIYRLPVLVIDEQGRGEIDGRAVEYTPERGLEVPDSAATSAV